MEKILKILLINPPPLNGPKVIREGRCEQRLSSFQYVMVPISLPMTAGLLLQNNFEVKIYDFMVEDFDFSGAISASARFKPDLVIINFSTLTYKSDAEFVMRLKKKLPNAHLVAIGVHVTTLPKKVLRETRLDSVVRGEPEITVLKLATALKNKKLLDNIRGLSYKKDGQIINNPARPHFKDLDSLPFAARHLLKNDRYFMPVYNRPYTLLITARGCPNKCTFCTAKQYYGNKFRVRRVEKVIEEIEQIVNHDQIKDITMWADTFTFDKKFVLELCQQIIDKKIKFNWMCNARVNTVDLEMLKAMKKAGCMGVAYGVESGVQKILNNVKKGTTLKQIERAFKLTRKANIDSLAHVIFGLPGETKKTINQTIKFIRKIDPDYVQFYCAIPFPGTEFRKLAVKRGWIKASDWNQYELNRAIINTSELSQKDLAKARKKAMVGFYLRKKFISRQLKKVKSFRDLLNLIQKGSSFLINWG